MPDFVYTARTLDGKNVTGRLTAANKREALSVLSRQSLFPLTAEEASGKQRSLRISGRISQQLIATNLTQLADLLQNGVPLMSSLDILVQQATHPSLARVLADVRDQVAEGESLDAAFASHPEVFDELTVSVVRAGSEGAFLEDALKRTADFMELQQELKSRMVGAMTYPAFLASAGTLVTVILIVFFVPKFAQLFGRMESQGGGLPLPTVLLLGTSHFLSRYGLFLLAGVGGLIWWLRRQIRTPRGRLIYDRWRLKLPVAGRIFLNSAVSRFCRVLGTLLRNGVPLLRALEISSSSAGNKVLSDAILAAAENISSGDTLSKPLAACGLIPRPIMAMISVAEESNNLDNVLVTIADGLDRRVGRQLDIMVRLVEPIMLLVMGVVILFVMMGLLLPVFEMSNSMG
jgi:general secretion pathway protein F/type IV pilus assembly protein PilC